MSEPKTLSDASVAIHQGDTTSVALTRAAFERADRFDAALGTYLLRFDEQALACAAERDAELAAGHDRGPLHGVPIAVKDIIATDEGPTTAQSLILDPSWGDQGDAPVVRRLREAGAVITGKTTTMEFACGCPDPTKPFPIPRNPWNLDRWPGGSSSGTGSGVAAGMFFGGLGTDTGGSIRCPASYCGISGHKQTFGLVPKSGCTPLGYSYDHIGPMAPSARDCAVMLQVMAGFDQGDPTASRLPVSDIVSALTGDVRGLRVGVDRSLGERPGVDPAVPECFDAAVATLAAAGASIVETTIPYFDALVAATMMGWPAEAFANHRRDLQERWFDYGRPTRLAIAAGALLSGADFVQAQRVRSVGVAAIGRLLRDTCDVLVTPTAATGAPPVEGLDLNTIVASVFTPIWNATGFPAVSVPMGFTSDGMPLGLQIAGLPFADGMVLKVGDVFQRHTDYHLCRPELVAPVAA